MDDAGLHSFDKVLRLVVTTQERNFEIARSCLEAQREVVDRAAATQERSVELIQATMTNLVPRRC